MDERSSQRRAKDKGRCPVSLTSMQRCHIAAGMAAQSPRKVCANIDNAEQLTAASARYIFTRCRKYHTSRRLAVHGFWQS